MQGWSEWKKYWHIHCNILSNISKGIPFYIRVLQVVAFESQYLTGFKWKKLTIWYGTDIVKINGLRKTWLWVKTARGFILSIFLSYTKVYLETYNVSDKHNVLVSEGRNLHCNALMEKRSVFQVLEDDIFLSLFEQRSVFYLLRHSDFDTIQFSPTILLNYCIAAFPVTQK